MSAAGGKPGRSAARKFRLKFRCATATAIRCTVSAQVGLGSYIRFTIADPKEGETLPYVNLSFENQNMEDGKVYISRMSDGVFSGTFEGGRITEGRFDLKYKE